MATVRHDTDFFSLVMRAENGVACLRLTGEIDGDCDQVLTRTAADLHRLAPRRLFVDLAEVSFAGATLVNFLVRVANALPPASAAVLCRPTPRTLRLLRLTATESLAAHRDHLPDAWIEVFDAHDLAVLDPASP